jgi:hypothetical protein
MRRESTAWAVELWWRHALATALIATYPPVYEPGCEVNDG